MPNTNTQKHDFFSVFKEAIKWSEEWKVEWGQGETSLIVSKVPGKKSFQVFSCENTFIPNVEDYYEVIFLFKDLFVLT